MLFFVTYCYCYFIIIILLQLLLLSFIIIDLTMNRPQLMICVTCFVFPQLFMACLWILLEVVMLFLYYDLSALTSNKEREVSDKTAVNGYNGDEPHPPDLTINASLTDNEFSTDHQHNEICSSEDQENQQTLHGVVSSLKDERRPRKESVLEKWSIAKGKIHFEAS